jgi:hypothetical protein
MRLLPHTICLMALRGRKTLHGRPLPMPEEAAGMLRRLTGQDFGLDAERWAAWIRANRRDLYRRRSEVVPLGVHGEEVVVVPGRPDLLVVVAGPKSLQVLVAGRLLHQPPLRDPHDGSVRVGGVQELYGRRSRTDA